VGAVGSGSGVRAELALVVFAPTVDQLFKRGRAGMKLSGADLVHTGEWGGAVGHDLHRRCVLKRPRQRGAIAELSVEIVAPTPHRSAGAEGARMALPGGDGADIAGSAAGTIGRGIRKRHLNVGREP